MSDITVPSELLEKVAQFIELADKENTALRTELSKKTASAKTVEVAKVPADIAKTAAQTLVTAGLLSAEFVNKIASDLTDPKALAATLTKVAELYAQKPAPLGVGVKTASKTSESPLAEASKRFAASVGIKK